MRRIELAAILAISLVFQPLAADAQQAGKVWRIGFISVTHTKVEDSFFQQLRELGYVERQNLLVERQYSEGRAERFAEFAAAFVRQNVDMIVVTTTPAGLAARNATKTIPIVQPNSIDPDGCRPRREPRPARRKLHGHDAAGAGARAEAIAAALRDPTASVEGRRDLERGQPGVRTAVEGNSGRRPDTGDPY